MKPHSLLRRRWPAMLLLLALTIGVFGLGLLTGTYDFSLAEVWQILWGKEVESAEVILDIRLPRVLLAFFTGVILAQGGFFMQALIKNPLADPYIMGLTAGAGFGVNLMILGFLPLAGLAAISYPLSAGLGGLLSLLLVMLLGFRSFQQDNAKLLIAGVAVSAIFSALTGFFIYSFAESDQVRRIVFWTFGSFGRARWEGVWVSGLLLLVSSLFGWMFARRMDVMLLGDRQAHSLGLGVRTSKIALLLVSALTVGGTVAFTGPIGFVGMMIPHFSRALFGSSHRPNLLLGGLLGGAFLLSCDVLSQWLLPPVGLPVGITTAILGVPFFLYVLSSKGSYL
jgi:iron complex transport system permease protein